VLFVLICKITPSLTQYQKNDLILFLQTTISFHYCPNEALISLFFSLILVKSAPAMQHSWFFHV